MGIGMVDGVEAGYCDLRNRILEIKQDWAKKIVDKDPRQLQYYTHVCFENLPPFFTDAMSTVKQDFNQTGGVIFYVIPYTSQYKLYKYLHKNDLSKLILFFFNFVIKDLKS